MIAGDQTGGTRISAAQDIARSQFAPRVAWSRLLGGKPPGSIRVFPSAQRLLLSIELSLNNPTCSLVCLDWNGEVAWARREMRGWLALPQTRFLASTAAGQTLVIDAEGELVQQWDGAGITQAALHGELVVMAHERQVWAVDKDLRPTWSYTWPGDRSVDVHCFVEGAFYYIENDGLWSCTPGGRANMITALPRSLLVEAYAEYGGSTEPAPDETSIPACWRGLSFDARLNGFFLTSFMPHVVVCVDRSGLVRWRRCLGPACCGGVPHALPDGHYAVSGGCNGVISWLDANGQLLFQSLPHKGEGLATAYSGTLLVLLDGTTVARGGPGLLAYSMTGKHLWTQPHGAMDCIHEATREVLVSTFWRQLNKEEATGCVEVLCFGGADEATSAQKPKDLRGEIARHLGRPWWKFW